MNRLNAGQVAVILERVRTAGMQTEADSLSSHIDALAGENRLLEVLQTVSGHIAKSTVAEQATHDLLKSFQPTIVSATSTLDRLVKVEERRMTMEENVSSWRYKHVIAPVVTGVLGILSGLAAHYVAS